MRILKEGIATIRTDLRENNRALSGSAQSVQSAFAYVAFTHNMHSKFRGSDRSPREVVVGRKLPKVNTGMYLGTVLAEVPKSLEKKVVSRFVRAQYLRPEFNSLGHVVVFPNEGANKAFIAKSIKLLTPIEFDMTLSQDFMKEFDPWAEPEQARAQPRVFDGQAGRDYETIRNVPTQWILEHGKTPNCTTCAARNFHGKTHNRHCVERYKRFLKDQDQNLLSEPPASASHPNHPSEQPPKRYPPVALADFHRSRVVHLVFQNLVQKPTRNRRRVCRRKFVLKGMIWLKPR